MEEAALKRKLEELTRHVSDHGASSAEEESQDEGVDLDSSTPIRELPRPAAQVRPPGGPTQDPGGGRARDQQGPVTTTEEQEVPGQWPQRVPLVQQPRS